MLEVFGSLLSLPDPSAHTEGSLTRDPVLRFLTVVVVVVVVVVAVAAAVVWWRLSYKTSFTNHQERPMVTGNRNVMTRDKALCNDEGHVRRMPAGEDASMNMMDADLGEYVR